MGILNKLKDLLVEVLIVRRISENCNLVFVGVLLVLNRILFLSDETEQKLIFRG